MIPDSAPQVTCLSTIDHTTNPYVTLLARGVVDACPFAAAKVKASWADPGDAKGKVLHLHWLEHWDKPEFLPHPRRSVRKYLNHPQVYAIRRAIRLGKFLWRVRQWQQAGGAFVYTVHNLTPHESPSPRVDGWALDRLLRRADAIHVHDQWTRRAILQRWQRPEAIHVIPHGNYVNAYPNDIDREEARARLQLPNRDRVFVLLGRLRPYKGLEELLSAFQQLHAPHARLLLAGEPGSERMRADLERQAARDPRILLYPAFVPAEEVQVFLRAADVCVLPYQQVTTSGAAMLALSFGLPVVGAAVGGLTELIAQPGIGLLYDAGQSDGLLQALREALETDWSLSRRAIPTWVEQFDWTRIGRQHGEMYAAISPIWAEKLRAR